MSFDYVSLSGLDSLQAGELQAGQRIPILTAEGLLMAPWSLIASEITNPLLARIEYLEENGGGGGGSSIWPTARTITLSGAITGSVALDGSQNVSMTTSIADASLSIAKVSGLQTQLNNIGAATNNRWGTGYTEGPQPSTFGGNLNLLSGATFVNTEAGTSNAPDAGNSFLILQNGPANYGQQIALRNGESWIRGQHLGTWSGWNKLWTSANLDPALLLLKSEVATSATQLANSRTFSLGGVITATGVGFNGTGNVALTTAIADGALTIAKISGLQISLDARYSFRGELAGALNAVTFSGLYSQTTAGNATVPNNYPIALAGMLRVVNYGSVITQEYLTSSNTIYHRVYTGGAWTTWTRSWTTADFDPTTKLDKTGGTITGDLVLNGTTGGGTIAVQNQVRASHFVTVRPDNGATGNWMLETYNGEAISNNFRGGIFRNEDRLAFVNSMVGGFWRAVSINNAGALNYEVGTTIHSIYHAGNFNPAMPVPTGGVLSVGDSAGTHLRFRNDGRYSVNGGTTWRELNESPGAITNPRYDTINIGPDDDIWLYEEGAGSGTLGLRTGDSTARKYFYFRNNGNFHVADGRVLIGPAGNEAWHVGNFDPATKLDTTANAATATRLQTPRTINGVNFDGSANITIPISLGDSPTITGATLFDVNGGSTGMAFIRNYGATGITFDAVNAANNAYVPLNLRGSAVTINDATVWHASNFNPATKLNARPEIDGVAHSITDWNLAITNGWFMGAGALNAPAAVGGNWLMGQVTQHNPNWVQQDVFQFTAGAATAHYKRHNNNGTWTAWTASQDFMGEISARMETGTSAYWADLPSDAQAGAFAIRWGGTRQWQLGIESSGAFKIWGYTAAGAFSTTAVEIARNGNTEIGGTLTANGGIRSKGALAMLGWYDRSTNVEWGFYSSTAGQAYLWKAGVGNLVSFNDDGSIHPQRLSAGWDSGVGGSINCSNWFRTTGPTGIFFSDYGGGVHMTDTTYVRAYNGKAMAATFFEATGGFSPQTSATSASFRAAGNYGGGFSMIDGGYHLTMYSNGGNFRFGFGSGSITSSPIGLNKDGTVVAADFALSSDATLKDELGPLVFNGRLRPVSFTWLATGKKDFGFMAQDVQKLYPEAVMLDADTGKLRLTQGKLTAVLASQLNQTDDRVEALQTEVADLKTQLDELRQLVENMRKQ